MTPPAQAIAFNAANYVTFTFGYVRAGAARVVFATFSTNVAANAFAAEVEQSLTISPVPALLAGDVIDVLMTQVGAGVAVPVGMLARVELN
jgi:hypothetical protein